MLSADVRQLRAMGKQLRKSAPGIYRATQKTIREDVGRKVVEAAKQSADWSTRIPATVRARSDGLAGVIVSAGGKDAPHAKNYEHAGAAGKDVRHPVFGIWLPNVKYDTSRPFLHPAALGHLQEHAETLAAALTVQVEKTLHGQDRFV